MANLAMEYAMPNIQLTDAMQDYAERQVRAGAYANVSEVARAGIRRLMEDDGATAFYLLQKDIEDRMASPISKADFDDLFRLDEG